MTDSSSEHESADANSSAPNDPDEDRLDWVGHWRVRRYDGAAPSVPTYYDASRDSWDVIKMEEHGQHVARHPILETRGPTILLKDEGAADEEAEEWRAKVEGDRLRVLAVTGPHEGAVGVAERVDEDPREHVSP